MYKKGILTVISGFSGTGKGTVVNELLSKYDYSFSVSATTRAPRGCEKHGKEYFFLTREEFECMINKNELVEWAEYVGNYYGTPKKYVSEQLESGKDVILDIEIQGALHVKQLFPEALLIFLIPPTAEELKKRLVGRGTEDMASIENRLSKAYEESDFINQYNYVVVNDSLEDCVAEVHGMIQKEHDRTERIADIKKQLKQFQKGE